MKRKLLFVISVALMGIFATMQAQTASVTFKVNMKYAIEAGKFNPSSDFVDVAGSFNNWSGSDHLTDNGDSTFSITLSDLTAGTIYEYKFRINGSWDADKHDFPNGGPNRKITAIDGITAYSVFNDTRPGYVPVNVSVNMSVWEQAGKFDPATQVVDIIGNFSDWSNFVELFHGEGDLIYKGKVIAKAGEVMQFKFRINHSWDADKHEFPNGGPNREFNVQDTAGGVVNEAGPYFFNDEETGIIAATSSYQFSIFPNPVANVLNIQANDKINKVIVADLSGRQVLVRLANSNNMQLALNNLSRGTYFVTIVFGNGKQHVEKIMKY
ncbi:MAG: T9SS type A sorting domain-containing protein [Bacteroidales bacterium]|nr:T9SS type A sorting domain-containing protein [Bacteroidales bacterium]